MSKIRRSGGFTLIEILMVLAIAGLITVLVFFGIEQGNRGKRDNARESDAGRYLAAAKTWVADNDGTLPDAASFNNPFGGIMQHYITAGGSPFVNPEGANWNPVWGTGAATAPDEMRFSSEATCNGGVSVANLATNHTRQMAVVIQLENGSPYCVSN